MKMNIRVGVVLGTLGVLGMTFAVSLGGSYALACTPREHVCDMNRCCDSPPPTGGCPEGMHVCDMRQCCENGAPLAASAFEAMDISSQRVNFDETGTAIETVRSNDTTTCVHEHAIAQTSCFTN